MRLFRIMSSNAHTLDERAFYKHDLLWMQKTFPEFTMIPVNYVSLPLGAISSFLFKNPDNLMLRIADKVDSLLAHYFPRLHHQFRLGIFVIHKL